MEKGKLIGISVLVFAIILILGLTGSFSSMFTGRASSNIVDCVDTDAGVQAEVGGNVIGSFDPTKARRDFCVNSTTLGEYYCDATRSDGKIEEIFCEFGCVDEGGFGVCKMKEKSEGLKCSQGCSYNGECLPVGMRVAGRYCDFTQALRVQKEGSCENSYECKSNLCISNECLSEEGGRNFLQDAEKTYFWE
ncbi:hypothetical protein HYV89_00400 [Candidatus Woesearchaeota archaeon]|nr:hypothetical protein [Candidatus Woesearchaeota archaeon]